MAKKTPSKFSDLNEAQLKAAAAYFGTEEEGSKAALVADLVDFGVEWEDYLSQPVPLKPEELEVKEDKPAEGTVTTEDLDVKKEEPVTAPVEEVVVAETNPALPSANYLIKMDRDNWYFEFGKYKFTKDKPYNIMPAEDAQRILTQEVGFRQAFPDELREFYS